MGVLERRLRTDVARAVEAAVVTSGSQTCAIGNAIVFQIILIPLAGAEDVDLQQLAGLIAVELRKLLVELLDEACGLGAVHALGNKLKMRSVSTWWSLCLG